MDEAENVNMRAIKSPHFLYIGGYMSWIYWKCRVKRGTDKKWTVYVNESGHCLSHHKTWSKAINVALRFTSQKEFGWK